jgi:hypothetical protein
MKDHHQPLVSVPVVKAASAENNILKSVAVDITQNSIAPQHHPRLCSFQGPSWGGGQTARGTKVQIYFSHAPVNVRVYIPTEGSDNYVPVPIPINVTRRNIGTKRGMVLSALNIPRRRTPKRVNSNRILSL